MDGSVMFLLRLFAAGALGIVMALVLFALFEVVHVHVSVTAHWLILAYGPDRKYMRWFLRRDGRLERLLAETLLRSRERGFDALTPGIFWKRAWLFSPDHIIAESLFDERSPNTGFVMLMERKVGWANDDDLRIIIAHELAHLHILRKSPHPLLRRLKHMDDEVVCNLFAAYLFSSEALLMAQRRCGISDYGFRPWLVEFPRDTVLRPRS